MALNISAHQNTDPGRNSSAQHSVDIAKVRLTLNTLGKFSADDILYYFSYYFEKNRT